MTISGNKVKKFEELYDYWSKTPFILEVDEYTFREIANQPFRDSILGILRKGIIDENDKKRHILTAPEMLPLIRKKLKTKVKLTNVYFHLEKLEKAELIEKVFTKKEGKTFVTYYGRTTKMIIYSQRNNLEGEKPYSQNYDFEDLNKIVKALGVEINTGRLSELLDEINKRNQELYEKEKEWMENNQDILIDNEIDIYKLYVRFQSRLRVADPILNKLHVEFYEEIGVNIYGFDINSKQTNF